MDAEAIDLRFFSLGATVRTDVPEVARYARDLFARFVDGRPTATAADYTLRIMAQAAGRWHVADSVIDAEVDQASWLTGIVAARILETVGNQVTEHDLFHAAALERDGRGLLICGESGFGKSTLALALLDHDFRFLSDEVGVVDRAGTLLPFPKALEMRPGRGAIELPAGGTPGRSGKRLYDVERIRPGCLGRPRPLAAAIFLEPWKSGDPRVAGELSVTVHRRVKSIPEGLRKMKGVRTAEWTEGDSGQATLRVAYEPEQFAPWTLPEELARHGALIVGSSAETSPPDGFDQEPSLAPLPAHDGVRRLLGQFRGTRALPDRIEAHGGDFGGLFVSMLKRLEGVRFARLRVGRLSKTLECVDRFEAGSLERG